MRHLTITFNSLVPEDDLNNLQPTASEDYDQPLTNLSRYVPNLQELNFGYSDVDGPPIEQHPDLVRREPVEDDILEILSSAILRGRFDNLKAVTFFNIVATVEEVAAFATRNRKTLRQLTIDGFRQVASSEVAQGMFDGLLHLSQGLKTLELEQVTLKGPWIDANEPVLTFERSDGSAIVHQIERCICHQGDFPRSAFETLIKKILRGEGRAEGTDLVYEASSMRLRMMFFHRYQHAREYIGPSPHFAHAMRHAQEIVKGM